MSAPRREPKPRPGTLERRREILKTAFETFGAKGYNKAPLTEIADQLDITHAGILHHFGSKDQLLLEVLRYRDDSVREDLQGHRLPPGMGMFRHLVKTAFINTERPGIVQAYAVLSAESVTEDNPGREYFESRFRGLRLEVVEAFMTVCQARGIDRDSQVVLRASAAIIAVMDGLQVQWLLDRDAIDLGATSRFAIEAIVAAVLEGAPPLEGD